MPRAQSTFKITC